MGACDVYLEIPGHVNLNKVEKVLAAQRREDRDYNGHQEGYSGDWQTIQDIDHKIHVVDLGSAKANAEACAEMRFHIEKWSARVVHTKLKHGRKVTMVMGLAAC